MSEEFQKDLEAASKRELAEPRRSHLGASEIGAKCAREIWGKFRWVLDVPWRGDQLRLLDRGSNEEVRVHRWLTAMNIEIRPWAERLLYHAGSDSFYTQDWDDPISDDDVVDVSLMPHMVTLFKMQMGELKQWGFTDHEGHFAGSNDGKIKDLTRWFPLAKGWGLLECKTAGQKAFDEMLKQAVQQSKPEHYIQMQEYMKYMDLPWALYVMVCKNNDQIYVEFVTRKIEVGDAYSHRAGQVISAQLPPPRISSDPSFFGCRFCDIKRLCHYGEEVEKNCRSCQFASPGPDKTWVCGLHRKPIPAHFIPKGCDKWVAVDFGGK